MKQIATGLLAIWISVGTAMADQATEPCPEQTTDEAQCMKCVIYHEARGEDLEGQIAVALVVENRVESDEFPDTICDVVWQKGWVRSQQRYYGQFSFTTDGASDQMAEPDAIILAEQAYAAATVLRSMGLAEEYLGIDEDVLWYHVDGVNPAWSKRFTPVVMIGDHVFYENS